MIKDAQIRGSFGFCLRRQGGTILARKLDLLRGQSDGGILRADPDRGFMLKDERTPSPRKPFIGSDAVEASAKRKIAIRRVELSRRR